MFLFLVSSGNLSHELSLFSVRKCSVHLKFTCTDSGRIGLPPVVSKYTIKMAFVCLIFAPLFLSLCLVSFHSYCFSICFSLKSIHVTEFISECRHSRAGCVNW